MKQKNLILLSLAVCMVLSMSACTAKSSDTPPVQADVSTSPQSNPPKSELPASPPSGGVSDKFSSSVNSAENGTASSADAEAALAVAELYRPLYKEIFAKSATEITLSSEEMKEILGHFASLDYAAIDSAESFDMVNSQLVTGFLEDINSGNDSQVSIYQILPDAGLVCNKLSFKNAQTSVTMTRLAWLDDGPFALAGDVPTVTYSHTFSVTDIRMLDDGYLYFEYYMPNNPQGTNHDGHIETNVKIRVGAK